MNRDTAAMPPLASPYYGASFSAALGRFWRKYVDFAGRSSRAEYWKAFVVYGGIQLALTIGLLEAGTASQASYRAQLAAAIVVILWFLWAAATLLPALAILARRLRDAGRTPWLLFAFLVGIGIVPLIMAALPTRQN